MGSKHVVKAVQSNGGVTGAFFLLGSKHEPDFIRLSLLPGRWHHAKVRGRAFEDVAEARSIVEHLRCTEALQPDEVCRSHVFSVERVGCEHSWCISKHETVLHLCADGFAAEDPAKCEEHLRWVAESKAYPIDNAFPPATVTEWIADKAADKITIRMLEEDRAKMSREIRRLERVIVARETENAKIAKGLEEARGRVGEARRERDRYAIRATDAEYARQSSDALREEITLLFGKVSRERDRLAKVLAPLRTVSDDTSVHDVYGLARESLRIDREEP